MTIKFFLTSVILICFAFSNSYAQHKIESKSITNKLVEDGIIFLKDGAGFFTYPFRMSSKGWLYTGGITAGTYGLMYTDQTMKDFIGRNTNKTLNGDFWDIPTSYGIVGYANITALSTYAVGLFSGEDEVRRVGRLLFQSISYSGLAVMAVRIIFGRERPYSGKGPWVFNGITLKNEIQSFPSGHTTVAFAFSTVLAEYFDTVWSRIGFYGMATLTGYARLLNNQHWFSDIVFGALIGLAGGFYTMDAEYNRNSKSKFSITPGVNGINFCYRLN